MIASLLLAFAGAGCGGHARAASPVVVQPTAVVRAFAAHGLRLVPALRLQHNSLRVLEFLASGPRPQSIAVAVFRTNRAAVEVLATGARIPIASPEHYSTRRRDNVVLYLARSVAPQRAAAARAALRSLRPR